MAHDFAVGRRGFSKSSTIEPWDSLVARRASKWRRHPRSLSTSGDAQGLLNGVARAGRIGFGEAQASDRAVASMLFCRAAARPLRVEVGRLPHK
jgi:hypothetical protein